MACNCIMSWFTNLWFESLNYHNHFCWYILTKSPRVQACILWCIFLILYNISGHVTFFCLIFILMWFEALAIGVIMVADLWTLISCNWLIVSSKFYELPQSHSAVHYLYSILGICLSNKLSSVYTVDQEACELYVLLYCVLYKLWVDT